MIHWRSVDPDLLEPQFRADIEALLGADPADWYVLYGFRTGMEQAELYAKYQAGGPKAAPPGKSPHNWGLAVDVVPDKDPGTLGLQPEWDVNSLSWRRIFEAIHRHPRLHSGKSFQDADHIERYQWETHKSWKTWT
jgi:hypothetical protein